jgi:hypothetical protein
MFGTVRPLKPELLVREFLRYRTVYCGLCKTLKVRYGTLPRLTLTYDMTFFALLFLALSDKEATISEENCLLNPFSKRPVAKEHDVLDLSADYSVLLAYMNLKDDVEDEGSLKSKAAALLLRTSYKLAARRLPEEEHLISSHLNRLAAAERQKFGLEAADIFGALLGKLFEFAAKSLLASDDPVLPAALDRAGDDLGRWVYLLDAIADLGEDRRRHKYNPIDYTEGDGTALAENRLIMLEEALDRDFALLPYRRDGGMIRNIIVDGLPAVRRQVISGKTLGRL